MSQKISRKEEFLDKKIDVADEYFNKICTRKYKKNKDLENDLIEYGNKMVKLILKEYKIHRPTVITTIKNSNKAPNGAAIYKSKIPNVSVVKLNVSRFAQQIQEANTVTEKAVIMTQFTQTCFHEPNHIVQHDRCEKPKESKNMSPVDIFQYSLEFTGKEVLGKEYYKKGDNYWKMLFEKDAREFGFKESTNLFSKSYDIEELGQFYTKEKIDDILNDTFLEPEMLYDKSGKLVDRQDLNFRIAASGIRRNPKLLKKYPILKKAFNKDGSRKPMYEIIKARNKEEFKTKMNIFLDEKEKKSRIARTNNLYSEIFMQEASVSSEKDLDLTIKMVGKKQVNKMINISQRYELNKEKDFLARAEEEVELRNIFDVQREYSNHILDCRKEYVYARHQQYEEDFSSFKEAVKNSKAHMESLPKRTKQKNKDNLVVNLRTLDNKLSKKQVKTSSRPAYSFDFDGTKETNEQLDISNQQEYDIDTARDLKESYTHLKDDILEQLNLLKNQYEQIEKGGKDENEPRR